MDNQKSQIIIMLQITPPDCYPPPFGVGYKLVASNVTSNAQLLP